ncbi:MAG: response regulator transcription factor [Lachnospiraceae bacterium]|nr:response regulator transcription factor [Lachnospiraceae bacterium]
MKLLLAEDEKRMADALTELFKQEGYDTDYVSDGENALLSLTNGTYDIAVLDVMMPKMNGFTVVEKAREAGITTPILMLTAKGEIDDKVKGLDSGADDYLTKPFLTKELLARLRALTRRTNADYRDDNISFGDITLLPSSAELMCNTTGQTVRLSEKEYRILEYMITNKGMILSREQLAIKIWGYDNDAEYNNVEVYMTFTRKKLKFVGATTKIKAVRGMGYELRCKNVP